MVFNKTIQTVLVMSCVFVLIHTEANLKCTKDSCSEETVSEPNKRDDDEHEDSLKYARDQQHDFGNEMKTSDCLAPDRDDMKIEDIPDNEIDTENVNEEEEMKIQAETQYLNVEYPDILPDLRRDIDDSDDSDTDEDEDDEETDEIELVELFIDDSDTDEEVDYEYVEGEYEFPELSRVDPGRVEEEVQVELEEGVTYTRITRAVHPPVFEIPDFLTPEECDLIISSAERNGLNMSNVFGEDVSQEYEDEIPLAEISRVSEQTWLDANSLDEEFYTRLHRRVARLTNLPVDVIQRGEPMQVVSYVPGGHYHAHLDTVDADYDKPCCFQTRCGDKEETAQWNECCRLCRYITVLYYLNDPGDGGETAFPIADFSQEKVDEKFVNVEGQDWYNLSYYCHNSSLVVKPRRGTAVMWYNHLVDDETGYLGKADRYSHHGGCDLKRGSKWIANNWISAPTKEFRFRKSVFFDG